MRSELFWDITQRRVVVPYWRFGKTYRSLVWTAWLLKMLGLLDPWRWDRKVVPKCRYRITTLRCVKSQNSADLIYITAEALNHTCIVYVCVLLLLSANMLSGLLCCIPKTAIKKFVRWIEKNTGHTAQISVDKFKIHPKTDYEGQKGA